MSGCHPSEQQGDVAPPPASHPLSLVQEPMFKVQRKVSGAFSGHGETQMLPGGGHTVILTSFAIFTQRDKNIFLKKKAFKRTFLEANFLNSYFYIPGAACSQL